MGLAANVPLDGNLGPVARHASERRHGAFAASNGTHRKAPADDLGQRGDVRFDAELRLCPAVSEPERDHFVEHEQRADFSCRVSYCLQELRFDRWHPYPVRHDIEQHGCELIPSPRDRSASAFDIVEGDDAPPRPQPMPACPRRSAPWAGAPASPQLVGSGDWLASAWSYVP